MMNNLLKYITMFLTIVFARHVEPIEADIHHVITLVKLFCADSIRSINAPYDIVASHVSALYCRHYAETGKMPLASYAYYYCAHKMRMYTEMKDFGAWGDIIECLTRCALKRNIHLCRITDFHSAGFDKNDIVSRKLGSVEIGHNGKSFMAAMPNDFMCGNFQTVIYGVFDEQDRAVIMDYISTYKLDKAIAYVADSMRVWTDKYAFLHDMDCISRGKGIVWKPKMGGAQVVYNPSKHKAFIDNCNAPTLTEVLKKL